MLIGDMTRILKCAIFLKENRILLLTDELNILSRMELHENIRKFVDVDFKCRHFHGQFTISHVGHYPDLVGIATHVIVNGFDQSILEENVVYDFPQTEPDTNKYLQFMPKAHSTPHDNVHELVQAIEGLDVNVFQKIVGRAPLKHGLEFFSKGERENYDQREIDHDTSHLDPEGVLQASQVMVQQFVEKGMLKGSIPN